MNWPAGSSLSLLLVGPGPMIQAGVLTEFHTWYGSTAIKQVTGIHRRISKESP